MRSTAEMISEVIANLGDPPQGWLSAREVARILRNRLSLVVTRLNQSDQNHTEAQTEFSAFDGDDVLLPSAVGTPDWAEVAVWDGGNGGRQYWRYVPAVNLDSLEDWRREGKSACSFYQLNGRWHIKTASAGYLYNGAAQSNWRVYYSPNTNILAALEQPSSLPPNFNFLITDGTIVDSVGFLLNNAARDANNPPTELQVSAWREMQSAAANRLIGWTEAFEEFKNRSRGGQRGRSRRNVLRGFNRYY